MKKLLRKLLGCCYFAGGAVFFAACYCVVLVLALLSPACAGIGGFAAVAGLVRLLTGTTIFISDFLPAAMLFGGISLAAFACFFGFAAAFIIVRSAKGFYRFKDKAFGFFEN